MLTILFCDNNIFISLKKYMSISILVCMLLAETFALAGCGRKTNADVPELKEPVATTLAFRPVTRRHIGNVEILMGIVLPAAYYCKADKAVTISSIEVSLGEYVKEGQTLAYGDTSEYAEQVYSLNRNIAELTDQKKCREEVSEQQIKILEFQKKECRENGDKAGVKTADNEIALEKENLRYEISVIDNNINEAKNNIAAVNEEMAGLTFTAPHDGFVSYIAPVEDGSYINTGDSIVVISDEDELYIETDEVISEDYKYENYKNKWAVVGGKNVPVTEYKFSDKELEWAGNKGIYPPMRFVVSNDLGLSAGMTVPLYFVKGEYRECLSVGNDSIHKEDDLSYVYVKGENGELVRRTVTLGESDKYYSEVTDGLDEGEEVFYENSSIVPASYSDVTVKMSDYSEELSSEYYEAAMTKYNIYLSQCNGVIDSDSIVKSGETVRAGDVLFGISTVTGKAELYEAKLAVDNLDSRHKQAEENYKKQKKLLDKELKALDSSQYDAQKSYREDIIKCDKKIINIERKYENDGYKRQREDLVKKYNELSESGGNDGCIYVKATDDGVMGHIVSAGSGAVSKKEMITVTGQLSDDVILVKMKSSAGTADGSGRKAAVIGQQVEIRSGDRTFSGKCVGENVGGVSSQFYVKFDNVKLSDIGKSMAAPDSDMSVDKEDLDSSENKEANDIKEDKEIKVSFDGIRMDSVITIPRKALYSETDSLTQQKNSYVWRLEGDMPVKEYVLVCDTAAGSENVVVLLGIDAGDNVIFEQ